MKRWMVRLWKKTKFVNVMIILQREEAKSNQYHSNLLRDTQDKKKGIGENYEKKF